MPSFPIPPFLPRPWPKLSRRGECLTKKPTWIAAKDASTHLGNTQTQRPPAETAVPVSDWLRRTFGFMIHSVSVPPISKGKGARRRRQKKFPSGSQRRSGRFAGNRPVASPDFLVKKVGAPIDIGFLEGMQIAWASPPDSDAGGTKRSGRHTAIDDRTLLGHATELHWLLGSAWPAIGWQLQHLKKPDDIRAALEPLRDRDRGLLNPLLRLISEKATGAEVRKSSEGLGEALTRHSEAEKRHRVLVERSQLADAALSQVAPEQRETVELEAKKRWAELEKAKKALDQANKEVDSLEKKLRDQEAYYCRAELFKFIRSKKYACNPRNLAFAMTGLPYIGCAWSVSRCQKQKPNLIELENYRLVEFIRRIWERKESWGESAIVELFATAIRALPKGNYLRTHLAENWRDLKRAVRYGLAEGRKPDIHPRRVPYLIASNFFKSQSSKTAVEQLLTEQERLDLGKKGAS